MISIFYKIPRKFYRIYILNEIKNVTNNIKENASNFYTIEFVSNSLLLDSIVK